MGNYDVQDVAEEFYEELIEYWWCAKPLYCEQERTVLNRYKDDKCDIMTV